MLRATKLALALATAAGPAVALAGTADVSLALREQAEALCRDDALRLCADAVPNESAIITYMRPKRAMLTTPCRKVFDEVLQEVRR